MEVETEIHENGLEQDHEREGSPASKKRRRMPSAKKAMSLDVSPQQPPQPTKSEKPAWRKSFPQRPYHCLLSPYGCVSSFSSKNEWKRHMNTQHMRLGFWRCDQCPNPQHKPNDFNRKDLFTQHLRRMHPVSAKAKARTATTRYEDGEERELNAAADRCYVRLRSLPAKLECVFCGHATEGSDCWNAHIEHVAKHMEQRVGQDDVHPRYWQRDQSLERWLVDENLVAADGERWVLSDAPTEPKPRRHSTVPSSRRMSDAVTPSQPARIAPKIEPPLEQSEDMPANDLLNAVASSTSPKLDGVGPLELFEQSAAHAGMIDRDLRKSQEISRPPKADSTKVKNGETRVEEELEAVPAPPQPSFQPINAPNGFRPIRLPPPPPPPPPPQPKFELPRSMSLPQTNGFAHVESYEQSLQSLVSDLQERVRSMLWRTDSSLFLAQWRPATAPTTLLRPFSEEGEVWAGSAVDAALRVDQWQNPLPSPIQRAARLARIDERAEAPVTTNEPLRRRRHTESRIQELEPTLSQADDHWRLSSTGPGKFRMKEYSPSPLPPLTDRSTTPGTSLRHGLIALRDQVVILEKRLNHPRRQSALESTLGMVWGQLVRNRDAETQPNALLYNLVQSVAPNVLTSASVSMPDLSARQSEVPITEGQAEPNTPAAKVDDLPHSRVDSAYESSNGR